MAETSARFALPFIMPGQAQKELYHNEALMRIDAALHPAVEQAPLATPPANPAEGQCWIVATGGSGAWSGRDGSLAVWTEGGWRFVPPVPGMTAWSKDQGVPLVWNGSAWNTGELICAGVVVGGAKVVGGRQPAVPNPSGGTVIDVEARAAIDLITAALKSHGLTD